jgi:hypothetical protein
LQPRADRPRLAIKLSIGDRDLFVFAVDQVDKCRVVGLAALAVPQELDQSRRTEKGSRQSIAIPFCQRSLI